MTTHEGKGARRRIWLLRLIVVALAVVASGWIAFQVSPWPSVLAIRWVFDRGSQQTSEALRKHVPPGVVATLDVRHDARDPDGFMDVYRPAGVPGTPRRLTTVVWIHGGGFVSGRKEDIGNYARILAAQGFVVVSIDYTLAPTATHPTPTRQANHALAYLVRHADVLNIDPARLVVAGDSAGAQIAAELANAITSPAHARRLDMTPAIAPEQLAGALLYCGPYDVALVDWDSGFSGFMRTVLWSYLGRKDFMDDPRVGDFSVARHVTGAFPPSFISVGNADPLAPHSKALATALQARGVAVETLFFPADYTPALPHEYQFNLDTAAGQQALSRSVAWLQRVGQHETAASHPRQ